MNKENFIKLVNSTRIINKDRWYVITEVVDGKLVEIKGFGTWLQIFRIDGLQQNTLMDINVTEFKNTLEKSL